MTESVKKEIYGQICMLPVIDSHEHLVTEDVRTRMDVDVFTLFSQYSRWDLVRAGMTLEENKLLYEPSVDLDRKWDIFAPYWEEVRYGSFSRASLISIKRFYGFDDLNAKTYGPISEAVRLGNRPGLYDRILREACGISAVLNQNQKLDQGTDLMLPVMYVPIIEEEGPVTWGKLNRSYFSPDSDIRSLGEYTEKMLEYLRSLTDGGAVGLKICSYAFSDPNEKKAEKAFEDLKSGMADNYPAANPITDYTIGMVMGFAREKDIPVSVHSGYWGDFRETAPALLIPLYKKYPDVRFDLYHLGIPYTRDVLMIAKNFGNVWVDLCWTHAVSQSISAQAVEEAIDLVPMNKMIAFGGDYLYSVENVYGHLALARENIAEGFARKVKAGNMTVLQAVDQIRKWFWDNPAALYKLKGKINTKT